MSKEIKDEENKKHLVKESTGSEERKDGEIQAFFKLKKAIANKPYIVQTPSQQYKIVRLTEKQIKYANDNIYSFYYKPVDFSKMTNEEEIKFRTDNEEMKERLLADINFEKIPKKYKK